MILKAIYLAYFMENNFWYFLNSVNLTQFSKKKKKMLYFGYEENKMIN